MQIRGGTSLTGFVLDRFWQNIMKTVITDYMVRIIDDSGLKR